MGLTMKKMIIGIHGLSNKPPRHILQEWWLASINEGLEKNGASPLSNDSLQMVYWADEMYVNPLTEDAPEPFKLTQPYIRLKEDVFKRYDPNLLDWLRDESSDLIDDILDRTGIIDQIANPVLSLKLKDLAVYWDDKRAFRPGITAKNYLCNELKNTIVHARDSVDGGCSILLIAHSMGSIIAFDTLREDSGLSVDNLLTIGCPLGLPRVKRKAVRLKENGNVVWPTVPAQLKRWQNYSEKRDPVALDCSLRDDYLTSTGEKFIEDYLIINNYTYEENGKTKYNYHKSYGYLRCPEIADAIAEFLNAE